MISATDIPPVLDAHLGRWADEHQIPVSWDNLPFTPPDEGIYLQSHGLPATPYSLDLAGRCLVFPGVYQVNVIAKAATGRTLAAKMAKDIATLFYQNLELSGGGFSCWILSVPAIYAGVNNGINWTLPVSMNYRAETTL